MTRTEPTIYSREPVRHERGIPVFCESDEFIENYDEVYESVFEQIEAGNDPNDEEIFLEMERADVDLIQKYTNGGKILDCGVAMGRILDLLPETYDKHGFDINIPCLEMAKSKGIEVCCAMVEDLPYKEGTFDLALASDFLEHVLDLNRTVEQILKTIRPGGLLFVRSPWREEVDKYLQKDFPHHYHHLRNFDENNLQLLFERVCGCEVLEYRLVGYDITPERRKSRLPFCGRLTRWSRGISEGLYRSLLERFYMPHEIEMVIQKPE